MGSVQQFKPHLWSCPGLCVLELQRGGAGSGPETATHWWERHGNHPERG